MKKFIGILPLFLLLGCESTDSKLPSFAQTSAQSSTIPNDPALIAKGAKVFKYRCSACHSMDAKKSQFFGPHLADLIDREIATIDGYTFPETTKQHDIVWTESTLYEWLENPQKMVKDMCMPFTGLPKKEDRDALMAYLKYGG